MKSLPWFLAALMVFAIPSSKQAGPPRLDKIRPLHLPKPQLQIKVHDFIFWTGDKWIDGSHALKLRKTHICSPKDPLGLGGCGYAEKLEFAALLRRFSKGRYFSFGPYGFYKSGDLYDYYAATGRVDAIKEYNKWMWVGVGAGVLFVTGTVAGAVLGSKHDPWIDDKGAGKTVGAVLGGLYGAGIASFVILGFEWLVIPDFELKSIKVFNRGI